MVAPRVVVCFAVLAATAVATNVQQCPGQSIENLSENVQLFPCKKPPCRLKKGTDQAITIIFTPGKNITDIQNHVTAEIASLKVPFVGVDGLTICDKIFLQNGDKVSCPLTAGTKYTYKDTFPVYGYYPSINTKVHWELQVGSKDIICFEVPVRIS